MRLIDADEIGLTDFEIVMCDGSYKKALEMLINKIANAPTIDAVPVIHCNECKHMEEHYDTEGNAPYWVCKNWYGGIDSDGYWISDKCQNAFGEKWVAERKE